MVVLRKRKARKSYAEDSDLEDESQDDKKDTQAITTTKATTTHDDYDWGDQAYFDDARWFAKVDSDPNMKRRISQDLRHFVNVKRRKMEPPKVSVFPFLQLPAELRNAIYEYALLGDDSISLEVKSIKYARQVQVSRADEGRFGARPRCRPTQKKIGVSLLRVNKQIFSEAERFLYTQTFKFENAACLGDFLAIISKEKREMLQRIVIKTWRRRKNKDQFTRCALLMLKDAVNLQSIEIACEMGRVMNQTRQVEQITYAFQAFIKEYGHAHGDTGAAADVFELAPCNYKRDHYWSRGQNLTDDVEHNQAELKALMRKSWSWMKL